MLMQLADHMRRKPDLYKPESCINVVGWAAFVAWLAAYHLEKGTKGGISGFSTAM